MKALSSWHRIASGRPAKDDKSSPRDEESGLLDSSAGSSPRASPRDVSPRASSQQAYQYRPLRTSVENETVGPEGSARLRVSFSSPPPLHTELSATSDGPSIVTTQTQKSQEAQALPSGRNPSPRLGKSTTMKLPLEHAQVTARKPTQAKAQPSSSDKRDQLQREHSASLFTYPGATLDDGANDRVGFSDESLTHNSVFGSFFDLTTERLTHIFQEFDHDGGGSVSYEALRQGLLHWAGIHIDNDTQFNQLIALLDADGSDDITFLEFEGGVRLLMMQQLFSGELDPDWENSHNDDQTKGVHPLVVIDYNALSCRKTTIARALHMHEFMFSKREAWVQSRWIDAYGCEMGAVTLKRLAVKYRLHPLALECAITPGLRPKVEKYSTHHCIIVPLFTCEYIATETCKDSSAASSWIAAVCEAFGFLSRILWCCGAQRRQSIKAGQSQQLKISFENVTLFICSAPAEDEEQLSYDTLITFQRVKPKDQPWERVLRELGKSYAKLRQYDAQYLAYIILECVVDRLHPVVQTCRDSLSADRETLLNEGVLDLGALYEHKDQLQNFVRSTRPLAKMLTHIIEDDEICEGVTLYLRELRDSVEALEDDMRTLIAASETLEAEYEKYHSSKTERTLYRLSVISSIFLPAQFFTGVFGMNFDNMPELHWSYSYFFFWIGTIAAMVPMLIYFRCGQR